MSVSWNSEIILVRFSIVLCTASASDRLSVATFPMVRPGSVKVFPVTSCTGPKLVHQRIVGPSIHLDQGVGLRDLLLHKFPDGDVGRGMAPLIDPIAPQ